MIAYLYSSPYTNKVYSGYVYKEGDDDNKIEVPTIKCKDYVIEEKIINWNNREICYLSKEKPAKASPSIRNCYASNKRACCNFV